MCPAEFSLPSSIHLHTKSRKWNAPHIFRIGKLGLGIGWDWDGMGIGMVLVLVLVLVGIGDTILCEEKV